MKCIDLEEDVIKILSIYFSYNKKPEQKNKILRHIVKIQHIKLWKLRNATIKSRIIIFVWLAISKILRCSWIRILFDNFHQWKLIPLYLVWQYLDKNFRFYSNIEISHSVLHNFSKFYQELFFKWGKYLSSPTTLPSTLACQFIWFNKHIKLIRNAFFSQSFK